MSSASAPHPSAPGIEDPTEAVYAAIAYADVFDMPIERRHLDRFVVGRALDPHEIDQALASLAAEHRVVVTGALSYLPGRSEVVTIHADRTARAAPMWQQAEAWGRRIGQLPFVHMVAVTGGLAIDSVAAHDDIDYFIITRPGRLWLTRLMIIALGKVAERSDIELCPNYIVATNSLEMTPRTVYVARELAQMIPIVNPEACADLRRQNSWMFDFLPNATTKGDLSHVQPSNSGRLSAVVAAASTVGERVLRLGAFARLERWEMERKVAKLTTMPSRRPEVGAPDESSFSPDVCKGHVVGNAGPIDLAWRERLDGSTEATD